MANRTLRTIFLSNLIDNETDENNNLLYFLKKMNYKKAVGKKRTIQMTK